MATDCTLPDILKALNENQLAIAAAIEELSNWVEQRGSTAVAQHVKDNLSNLDRHQELITRGIGRLYLESQ
ncbi:hypothetical protein [Pseudomonas sp. TE3610]